MNPIRKRFGLTWKKSWITPHDVHLGDACVFIACLCAALFLAWNDARISKEIAEQEGNEMAASFANFLMGGIVMDKEQTVAIKCSQLLEVVK